MKPTQQEIIELAREAGIVFDERAMPYYARLVHLALERFGAGGGEPVAWMAYNTKTGERCPFLADDPDLQHAKSFAHVKTQALYLHPSPTPPAQQDAQAVEPLTDAQKDELWYRAYSDESRRAAFVWYFKGIADAERAHGIEALKGKQ